MSATTEVPGSLKIAIIGGGIGGLALAIGLLKHTQHDVQVYEAAHKFSEIGAGVNIGPNAQRALRLISDEAEQAFLNQATGQLHDKHKHTFMQVRYGTGPHEGELITETRMEATKLTVHRAKFLDELVKLIPPEIAHFGKRLTEIEEHGDEGVVLKFKDETSVTVDCVVGADGVHSVTRKHLLGAGHPALDPVFSGSVAYRGLVPMETAKARIGDELAGVANSHCGDGGLILTYPIDFGNTLNVVVIDSTVKSWEGPWVVPADYKTIAHRFSSWGTTSKKIIELLDNPQTSAWSMWESSKAPYFYRGRVVMTGDAAHATTPFQGQGAGQAIEDAMVLTHLLTKTSNLSDIPLAFAAYDKIRRPRAQEVCRTSHEAGEIFSMRFPGIGDDPAKIKENVDWRWDWIWHRDMQTEIDQTVMIFEALKDGSFVE